MSTLHNKCKTKTNKVQSTDNQQNTERNNWCLKAKIILFKLTLIYTCHMDITLITGTFISSISLICFWWSADLGEGHYKDQGHTYSNSKHKSEWLSV